MAVTNSWLRRVAGSLRRRLRRPQELIEIEVDSGLVRRLLEEQFPNWASLPLREVTGIGTVHGIFRLGDQLVVRVPRREWGLGATDRECEWLPRFAANLPALVPEVVGRGVPTDICPLPWLVLRWIPGRRHVPWRYAPGDQLALDLVRFVAALHRVPIDRAPRSWRGNLPLDFYDADVRRSVEHLDDDVAATASQVWDAALALPEPAAPPVWLHGDLWSGNLLVENGRLRGVVDWSSSGVGDRTRDLKVAWDALAPEPRARFREALAVDDIAWAQGRALAMATAIIDVAHFDRTAPAMAEHARYTLKQVLSDLDLGRTQARGQCT